MAVDAWKRFPLSFSAFSLTPQLWPAQCRLVAVARVHRMTEVTMLDDLDELELSELLALGPNDRTEDDEDEDEDQDEDDVGVEDEEEERGVVFD
jgi:hypothetical protein